MSGELDESIAGLERLARERLPRPAYDYYASGAGEETTLAASRAAWSAVRLRPPVLRDVSTVALSTSLLGRPVPHPILVAPTAAHRLGHPEGEVATARGAARA